MSPKKALKIIFISFAILIIASVVFYRFKIMSDIEKMKEAGHRAIMEGENNSISLVDEEGVKRELSSDELINSDLKKYGIVRQETVEQVIEKSNLENRRRNGLPVD